MTDEPIHPQHELNEHGGEVWIADEDEPGGFKAMPADIVEILNSGWVKLVFKRQYEVKYYPPRKVKAIHTHSTDEQEQKWAEQGDL